MGNMRSHTPTPRSSDGMRERLFLQHDWRGSRWQRDGQRSRTLRPKLQRDRNDLRLRFSYAQVRIFKLHWGQISDTHRGAFPMVHVDVHY